MTYEENRQRVKNEALNKIRKLYNPNTTHHYTFYDGEGSLMEQISFEAEKIIKEMELELSELKEKNKTAHVTLDLDYLSEESVEFVKERGYSTFMYKVKPISPNKK